MPRAVRPSTPKDRDFVEDEAEFVGLFEVDLGQFSVTCQKCI